MHKKTCIVLVGAPCSGKSSVGKLVANKLNIKYVSSGDIARTIANNDDTVKNDLEMGKLAPESQMRGAISSAIYNSVILDDDNTIILDGFPRFGEQAEWLQNLISHKIKIYYVLLYTPLSTIIERSINRNRSDDKSLEKRLDYYYNTTYKDLHDYIDITIDANENTVNECSALLVKFIKEVTEC